MRKSIGFPKRARRGFAKGWNKFNAKRTEFRGENFPSRLEANTYGQLLIEEKLGLVKDIERYPSVQFKMKCACGVTIDTGLRYKPDFKIFDVKLGASVWIEAKGVETPDWRKNKELWRAGFGPGRLRIYKARGSGVYLHEEII